MLNVVLVHPQIPPNTGNIARLCVATCCTLHLIHPLGFSISEPEVKRAGLDYWPHLKLQEHETWEAFLNFYPSAEMHFYSKTAQRAYCNTTYQKGDFLIFGSETTGLPKELLMQHSDKIWKIPMWGPTRSLNLATSVGIVVYEALRQCSRNFSEVRLEALPWEPA